MLKFHSIIHMNDKILGRIDASPSIFATSLKDQGGLNQGLILGCKISRLGDRVIDCL
jgi:hypothetical protein